MPEAPAQTANKRIVNVQRPGGSLLLFGVILPAGTIAIELISCMCADALFDPLPTIWHVLLVGLVPVSNLLIWIEANRGESRHVKLLSWSNGISIGVASFYSLLFFPILPAAVIGIMFFIGILPLAPLCSLFSAIMLRSYLKQTAQIGTPVYGSPVSGLGFGFLIAIMLLVTIELPTTVTNYYMHQAVSSKTRPKAIRMLREYGSEPALLRACYHQAGRATDLAGFVLSFNQPLPIDDARLIYYQVTGKPFNATPPPQSMMVRNRSSFSMGRWDAAQGGEAVDGRLDGLALQSSKLSGLIEPEAALSYSEWTMNFKNETDLQREARAQIALPPGGVVSRLTLWVNGEEREAAFAGRGKVRAAYQRIVSQRRDPVLVTTSGPDRILMQCFPVPPKGDMKIRFGVTAPLLLESPGEALLRLPHILERNFNLGTEHEVTLQSPSTMETTGAVWSVLDSTAPKVSAKLSDLQMSGPTALVRAQRPASTNAVWSKDSRSSDGTVVRQAVDKQKAETPRHVILVVDGSAYMRDSMSAIADSLTKLPDGISYGLVWAGDEAIELQPQQSTTRDNLLATAAALKALPCVGGADNTPALDLACKQFANADGNVIVWVHGPQPVLFENADKVRERWQKAKHPIKLYDVQIIPGPNRIAEKLDGIHAFQLWSQTGIASTDLERLFGLWAGVIDETTFKRERVSLPDVEKFPQASDHVTRLWAAEEVNRLVDEDTDPSTDAAVSLASKYQLVTSVTGAVVLETKQQFTEAGLEPVDANSVPTIPESETYALIAVLLAVLVWAYKRRQRWQVA